MASRRLLRAIYPSIYAASSDYLKRIRSRDMPATLVSNEVAIRLLGCRFRESTPSRFALMSFVRSVVKSVVIDQLRVRKTARRCSDRPTLSLQESRDQLASKVAKVDEELHSALTELKEVCPRKHSVVTLRYVDGLTMEEVAEHLGVSLSTVEKDWKFSRAWLRKTIREGMES